MRLNSASASAGERVTKRASCASTRPTPSVGGAMSSRLRDASRPSTAAASSSPPAAASSSKRSRAPARAAAWVDGASRTSAAPSSAPAAKGSPKGASGSSAARQATRRVIDRMVRWVKGEKARRLSISSPKNSIRAGMSAVEG